MKRLTLLLALLVSAHVFGDAWIALPDGWETPTGYSGSMTLFARVLAADGETWLETPGSTLAAFDGEGRCRGLAEGQAGSNGLFVYRLVVFSNQTAEEDLVLKLLDSEAGAVVEILETLGFLKGSSMGTADAPRFLHVGQAAAEVRAALRVSWPGRPDECLEVSAVSGVQDAYSDEKDVLAQTDAAAYLAGEGASGEPLKLQRSVHRAAAVTRWQLAVTVEPGETATIAGDGAQPEALQLYLYPTEGCLAIPLATDSLELKNESGEAKTWLLDLACAMPDRVATCDVVPGWNLVSFAFQPSPADSAALLALNPLAVDGTAYARASAIEANRGYWLFVQEKAVCVVAVSPSEASQALPEGWHLTGDGAAGEQADAGWQWQGDRFLEISLDQMVSGRAYWLGKFRSAQ